MGIAFGIGLNLSAGIVAAEATPPPAGSGHTASVAALTMPAASPDAPAVFDTGAARGANAADIALSGTTDAPDGTAMEGRMVRADTAAAVTSWTPLVDAADTPVAASGGAWSGILPLVPRSPHRLLAEVRPAGSTAAPGRGATEIVTGHVATLIGQSEDARMMSRSFDNRTHQTPPTITDEDAVFFIDLKDGAFGAGGVRAVTNAAIAAGDITASQAHMADVLIRNAPGEKFLVLAVVVSGTSYLDLADDDDPDRDWSTTFADGVAMIRAWGGDVGVLMSTWTAAPSASNDGYRQNLYPLFTGLYAPDHPTNPGATYTLGDDLGGGRNYDNLFWDLSGLDRPEAIFDPAVTKMAFHGPHRFEDYSTAQVPFVAPRGTYAAGYTSGILDVNGTLPTDAPLRLHTWDATGNTGIIVEVSATGVFAGEQATAFTGSGDVRAVMAGSGRYYRLTVTGGGRYFLTQPVAVPFQQKQDTRVSIRNFVDDPEVAAIMRPKGPEILAYQNGTPTTIPSDKGGFDVAGPIWADWSHPSDYSEDGLPARARHTAVAMLYALGTGPAVAQRHEVPAFNRAYWEPAGAYAEFWHEDSEGNTPPITTTRLARDGDFSGVPAGKPHVSGLFLDGLPLNDVSVAQATITGGRLRITPAAAFTSTSVVQFGLGGASGIVDFPEDEIAARWMDLPLADTGLAGIDGVAIEPLPDPADIASTVAGAPTFTVTNAGPSFSDSSDVGTLSAFTWHFKVRPTAPVNEDYAVLNNQVVLEIPTSGSQMSFGIADTGGNVGVSGLIAGETPIGSWSEVVVSVDIGGTNKARVWLNGTLTDDIDLTPNTGVFDAGREFRFLPRTGGGTAQFVGEVEFYRAWKAYTADGDTAALGTPHAEITGPASTANAHPWKIAGDAN